MDDSAPIPSWPFDITRIDQEFQRPFFEYLFEQHPDWEKFAFLESFGCVQGGVRGALRFPHHNQASSPLHVIEDGCELIISFDCWHMHQGLDQCGNIPSKYWDEFDALEDRFESGDAEETEVTDFRIKVALEYIEDIWNERVVLCAQYKSGHYTGAGMCSAANLNSQMEEFKQSAVEDGCDELRIFSAKGKHDQVVQLLKSK